MRKLQHFLLLSFFLFIPALLFAQTTISGNVKDADGEPLAGVNILVKGKVIGTITDFNGDFKLSVSDNPPFIIQISYVGFASQEINIESNEVTGLNISLEEQLMLGQEVVVSASRVEESILESPVSIEKMDILDVQNTPADNYYKAIANLKGVDMTASSINFQIVNTRGFSNTGNTRFVQLIDGMDTQAPALNFPIGNLNGPSELDVESVELIPGASSALYGPNAFNGVLLINSKNPFEYQGLSGFVKMGVNHVGANADTDMSPMYEASLRYAKAYNDKFAFKVNFSYSRAEDWYGTDDTDREIGRTPAGFTFNPGADRLHFMGDEASVNLAIFPLSSAWMGLADSPVGQFSGGTSGTQFAANYATAGDLPAHVVTVSPYAERHLIDYGAENIKANVGLYYRLNDEYELSALYNAGFGTSIYTGAQRYSLKNFGIQQLRLQLRSDNFMLRGYGTFEDSGDSYITEFLAKRINDKSSLFGDVTNWLGIYGINYLEHLYNAGYGPGEISGLSQQDRLQLEMAAHMYAREQTESVYSFDPTSDIFNETKATSQEGEVPFGPKFNDQTRMYHAETQYDFKNDIDFMSLQIGGSYRLFQLRSNGTIFPDTPENPITINEYGAYVQAAKPVANDKIKLSGSLRYDKNQNFDGQFNPRISSVFKIGENHNIRTSYQTGFRIPTTQGQHIDLNILTSRLLGGLPQYAEQYELVSQSQAGVPLGYEGFSVQEYSDAVFNGGANTASIFNPANIGLLEPITELDPVRPEQVRSFEIGYKSLINNKLLIDAAYYYNIYTDFITQIRVRKATEFTTDQNLADTDAGYSYNPDPNLVGQLNYATLLNGSSANTFQVYTNIDEQVSSQGAVFGLTYSLPKNYSFGTNYSWNIINDIPEGFLAEFNTPEHKVNFTFSNRKLTDNMGFSISYRWQSEFEWQSSFTVPANGMVPAFSTLDAQLSFELPGIYSRLKVGGSNLLNQKYTPSLGGPGIGAIYYVSLTVDDILK